MSAQRPAPRGAQRHPGPGGLGGRGFVGDRPPTTASGTSTEDYLEAGWLDHGYATTVHKSQGETVERAFVLGTGGVYREAAYVAMSRARTRSDLYVVDGRLRYRHRETVDQDPLADLKQLIARPGPRAWPPT